MFGCCGSTENGRLGALEVGALAGVFGRVGQARDAQAGARQQAARGDSALDERPPIQLAVSARGPMLSIRALIVGPATAELGSGPCACTLLPPVRAPARRAN